MNLSRSFTRIANATAQATGRPATFMACVAIVIIWAASGPLFDFSDTWQLIINTGTTIITFLMVFLIQNTQNRDNAAIQIKLDELIRSHRPASNRFIGVEHLTDEELEEMRAACEKAAGERRKRESEKQAPKKKAAKSAA